MKKYILIVIATLMGIVFGVTESFAGYCIVSTEKDSSTNQYSLRYKIETVYNGGGAGSNCTPPSSNPGDDDYFGQVIIFATAEAGYTNDVNEIVLGSSSNKDRAFTFSNNSSGKTMVIGNWAPDVTADSSAEVIYLPDETEGYEQDYIDALDAAGDYGEVTIDGQKYFSEGTLPFKCDKDGTNDVYFRHVTIKTNGVSEAEFFDDDNEDTSCLKNAGNVTIDSGVDNDADNDGYDSESSGGDDCDDYDSLVHPGASETCDGQDNDCNGNVDEGLATYTYYVDDDDDGYGDIESTTTDCSSTTPPEGHVSDNTDCDDTNNLVNPGSTQCESNGTDYNCDGTPTVDAEDCSLTEDCATVGDEDLDSDSDCDDTDCETYEGCVATTTEVDCSDDVDNDGDGATDCDDSDCSASTSCLSSEDDCDNYLDDDDDGDTDCDDSDCDTNPACEDNDADNDGYDSESSGGDDCDDTDATVYPSAEELCGTCTDDEDESTCVNDGIDQNCDGDIDEGCSGSPNVDDDGDGYSENGGDCDDMDPDINPDPDTVEICDDEVDNNCDGFEVTSEDVDAGITTLTCVLSEDFPDSSATGGCNCDLSSGQPERNSLFVMLLLSLIPLGFAGIVRLRRV